MRPTILILLLALLIPIFSAALYSTAIRYLIQDVGQHRTLLLTIAESYMQHPLQIAELRGDGRIRHPQLTLNMTRIKNDDFDFSADEIRMELDVWKSLLHFSPHIQKLFVRSCKLHLYRPYAAPTDSPATFLLFTEWNSKIDQLKIENCSLFLHFSDSEIQEYEIQHAYSHTKSDHQRWLAVNAQLQKQPVLLRARVNHIAPQINDVLFDAQLPASMLLQTLRNTGWLRPEQIPELQNAHAQLRLYRKSDAAWRMQARAYAAQLKLPSTPALDTGIHLQDLRAQWDMIIADPSHWQAKFSRLEFRQQKNFLALEGQLQRSGLRLHMQSPHIRLQDILPILHNILPLTPGQHALLENTAPSADLYDLQWTAPVQDPLTLWQLTARVEDLHNISWQGIPGVHTLNGQLQMHPRSGEFRFDCQECDISLPPLYPSGQSYKKFSGLLSWAASDQKIFLDARDLRLLTRSNAPIEMDFVVILSPGDPDRPPVLEMRAHTPQMDIATALAHIPAQTLASLPQWLYRKKHSGHVNMARLSIGGTLHTQQSTASLDIELGMEITDLMIETPLAVQLLQGKGSAQLKNGIFHTHIHFDNSSLAGAPWLAGSTEIIAQPGSLTLSIRSTDVIGTVIQRETGLKAELQKLYLPQRFFHTLDQTEGGELPTIDFRIADFGIDDDVRAQDLQFSLLNNENRLEINQLYGEYRNFGIRDGIFYHDKQNNRSAVRGKVSFCDWEELLAAYSCSETQAYEKRNNQLAVQLIWPGAISDFAPGKLSGTVQADLNNGRFLKIGNIRGQRFIQLLNIDSLLRRLQPNISALSSDGMSYKKARGELLFEDGILHIDQQNDLVVESSHGIFRLHGNLNIPQSSLDGELSLTLPVTENLPWYSILLGATPVGAASLWLTSRVFRNQIQNMFRITYTVQGSPEKIRFEIKE